VATWTEADFEQLSWHDCHVWGIEFRVGAPAENDWTSDLAFDIDYIVEWVSGSDGRVRFRLAPATLVFHGVTDPTLNIDWLSSGFQIALQLPSISRITRDRVVDQKVYLDRPYYRYRIQLNAPEAGTIEFGGVGFTQRLRGIPVLSDDQVLTRTERERLVREGVPPETGAG